MQKLFETAEDHIFRVRGCLLTQSELYGYLFARQSHGVTVKNEPEEVVSYGNNHQFCQLACARRGTILGRCWVCGHSSCVT